MLGRQEVREFDSRLSSMEGRVEKLTSLETVVSKLEDVLEGTREGVNHLNIFMERLEERSLARDRWGKITLGIIALCVPIVTAASSYFVTTLVDEVGDLEKHVAEQNVRLAELNIKVNALKKASP